MEIKAKNLKWAERKRLEQIIKARHGQVTVRQAREHVSPTGWRLALNTAAGTLVCAAMGLFFLPLLFVALVVPIAYPVMVLDSRRQWRAILPADRDQELVEIV